MDNRPIGIFDSGVGGLTVVREVVEQLPCESIIYLGDTARFPYGPKPVDELRRYVFEITHFLTGQDVKFIVIACNSAASAGLEAAQRHFDVPLIGVVEPGARAAVQGTRVRQVGVIGAQATISSQAYTRAIEALDAGIKVHSQACPELADLVEEGQVSGPKVEGLLKQYVDPLLQLGIDSLILGCTHYPLLAETISHIVGPGVRLISSAEETARELNEFLARKNAYREDDRPPMQRFISTGNERQFLELGVRFLGKQVKSVERLPLSIDPEAVAVEAE